MKYREIGEFIALKRKEKGLTQSQLAEIIDVSDKSVSKWECGGSIPGYSMIKLLSDALEIEASELISVVADNI